MTSTTEYTLEEIANHNTKESLWLIIDDLVYDVTKFLEEHPGGTKPFIGGAGKNVTERFHKIKKHKKNEHLPDLMKSLCIGCIKKS